MNKLIIIKRHEKLLKVMYILWNFRCQEMLYYLTTKYEDSLFSIRNKCFSFKLYIFYNNKKGTFRRTGRQQGHRGACIRRHELPVGTLIVFL